MPRSPRFNDASTVTRRGGGFVRWPYLALISVAGCLAAAWALYTPEHDPSPRAAVQASTPSAASQEDDRSATKPQKSSREILAAWYDVPPDSIARRRAGVDELTAAHNKLPLGTLVRVTHLENDRSVVVRITDRGITDRRVKLDVCKEAAEELEMVGKGIARVRMEIIPEQDGALPPETRSRASQP